MFDYSAIYADIVRWVRVKGVKHVLHKDLTKEQANGMFFKDTSTIVIDKTLRNTHSGCFFLLHEYVHFTQCKKKRYKKFFNLKKNTFPKHAQPIMLEWLYEIEKETDEEAKKLLWEGWGLFYDISERIDETGFIKKAIAEHFFEDASIAEPVKEEA